MNRKPKFLYYFILLLALAAAVYLAGRSQETRRSAYFAGARVNIVPESVTGKVGAVVPVQVFITSNKITGSEELARVSSLDATVCYGDGLSLNPNTLDDDIQLNEDAFRSIAFKQIEDLSTPVDGTSKCLKMVLITTGIEPSKLMSGTFRAATIRFRGAKAGSGKIIINTAIMGGYNPAPGATDTALEIGEKKGASYVISGASVIGDVNFFLVDTQNRPVTVGQSVEGFVNFKIGTNKLSGVDFRLKYDQNLLKFESVVPILSQAFSQYSSFCGSALFGADTDLIDKRVDETKGTINLAGVSMETDETKMPTDRVCLVRFKFKALANGEATVTLDSSYDNSAAGYFPGQTDQSIDVGNVIPVKFTIGGSVVTPTNTPPVTAPTNTPPVTAPTNTPPVTANWPILKYQISFRDVISGNMCASNWPVVITAVAADGTTKVYSNQKPVRNTSITDRVAYRGELTLVDFPYKQNVAIFVKGPKHLQSKYGVNNQSSYYGRAGGEVRLFTRGETEILNDFSRYPLMPGDVTGATSGIQDGVVDGRDYSYVKASATRIDEVADGGYLPADMDGNCKVNGMDTAYFKQTLKDKLEQMY